MLALDGKVDFEALQQIYGWGPDTPGQDAVYTVTTGTGLSDVGDINSSVSTENDGPQQIETWKISYEYVFLYMTFLGNSQRRVPTPEQLVEVRRFYRKNRHTFPHNSPYFSEEEYTSEDVLRWPAAFVSRARYRAVLGFSVLFFALLAGIRYFLLERWVRCLTRGNIKDRKSKRGRGPKIVQDEDLLEVQVEGDQEEPARSSCSSAKLEEHDSLVKNDNIKPEAPPGTSTRHDEQLFGRPQTCIIFISQIFFLVGVENAFPGVRTRILDVSQPAFWKSGSDLSVVFSPEVHVGMEFFYYAFLALPLLLVCSFTKNYCGRNFCLCLTLTSSLEKKTNNREDAEDLLIKNEETRSLLVADVERNGADHEKEDINIPNNSEGPVLGKDGESTILTKMILPVVEFVLWFVFLVFGSELCLIRLVLHAYRVQGVEWGLFLADRSLWAPIGSVTVEFLFVVLTGGFVGCLREMTRIFRIRVI